VLGLEVEGLAHDLVGQRQHESGNDEGEVNADLPPHHPVVQLGGVNEAFQEMDGGNADQGGGQLDLEHPRIDVGKPFGLIRVVFQFKPGNEGFIAADDDHDEQVGNHHHVDQAQDDEHDLRIGQGARLAHQMGQFHHELIDIHPLGDDQTQVEGSLEPAAPENKGFHALGNFFHGFCALQELGNSCGRARILAWLDAWFPRLFMVRRSATM